MDVVVVIAALLIVCFWINRRLDRLEELILKEFYEDDDDPEKEDLPELEIVGQGSVIELPSTRTYRVSDADIAAVANTATSAGAVNGLNQGRALRLSRELRERKVGE